MDQDPVLRFLGDWHYHPWGRGRPSTIDVESLAELSFNPDYLLDGRAIMIISTRRWGRLRLRGFTLKEDFEIAEIPVDVEQ